MENAGQQLGWYRLLRLLGRGYATTVYLAEALDRTTPVAIPVAIKVLSAAVADEEEHAFIDAVRIMARLGHPNIVRLYDFGDEDGVLYFVEDYASGGSVRQKYPQGSHVPLKTVTTYVKQIASALSYAYTQHSVHHHLKPENILLGTNDVILLSDFGFPSYQYFPFSAGTKALPSSVAYMAPEQLQGKPLGASDQYALGIIVYEWLNGFPPFIGSLEEIVVQHIEALPPLLSKQLPNLPPQVDQIILTALAKDPQNRFPDIIGFANALEQASLDS